jgi:WD40 repeat protein
LIATAHAKSVTVFSLATFSKHSALTGGHARSVRTTAWQPPRGGASNGQSKRRLALVTGSFDATAGLWSYEEAGGGGGDESAGLEKEVRFDRDGGGEEEEEEDSKEWEFNLVLEGHENEVKGLAFSPGGQYLATCSRDKSVWIWEDVGAEEGDDEWETVAVLSEHDGDVKAVAWCPSDLPNARAKRRHYSTDVLASASYDNTVRIWREDADGEWVCVSVLEGHEGTVWGLQWECKARADGRFPRLMTFSADGTIKLWTLREEEEEEEEEEEKKGAEDEGGANPFRSGFGGIPSTMRRSLREEWDCTAVLPKVHTRDVYSVSWSAGTGLVASTGSDGVIAVYAEDGTDNGTSGPMTNWRVLATVSNAHGPYEVNHITWCKRFDPGAECKGKEEMLVTTGDDGVVRPWQVRISSS